MTAPRVRVTHLHSAAPGAHTHGVGTTDRQQWWTLAVAVAGTAIVLTAVGSMLARGRSLEVLYAGWVFHNAPTAVIAVWLGRLVLRRRRGHLGGLLLLSVGVWSCLHVGAISLADAELAAASVTAFGQTPFRPADLPLRASVPLWLSTWLWVPAATTAMTLLLLVFPDGALPSRRWRWVGVVAGVGIVLATLAYMIEFRPGATVALTANDQVSEDPLAVWLLGLGGVALVVAVVASVVSLVVRWRAAGPALRRQIRPVVVTGIVFALTITVLWPWQALWMPAVLVAVWAFIASYAFAVALYRLHDLDLFVSRAVVGAVLAAAVTALYLLIVVGVGSLVGRGTQRTLLPLLATGVVAVLFEPARRRVRRLVDGILYDRDRDPSEVLSDLAARLRQAASDDEVLDDVARLLVRSTGAERAEIAMAVGGRDWVVAGCGSTARTAPLRVVPVAHRSDVLGEVRLYGRSSADLAPDAAGLVDDVAGTLGVVVRNAHLTAELRAQVDELQRSRQRLVQAHDEARRAIERDIHDGAQARLIALRIHLGAAARLAARESSPQLRALVDDLADEVDAAVRTLRSLGHGLHPPVLEGAGVAGALRAEARTLPLAVTIDSDGVGRYDRAVEAAVYFSCLEAVQNAAKHGRAGRVHIALSNGGAHLDFRVTDDGCGFVQDDVRPGAGLTNVRDRLSALGGAMTLDSTPGGGTCLHGQVPAQPLVSDR
jgi:two-component system, NarL family, sensor kinase